MSNKIGHAVFLTGFFASWGWLWRTPAYGLALGLVCRCLDVERVHSSSERVDVIRLATDPSFTVVAFK